ncbi:MAG: protein kinase [Planctomycetota bacterium]
MNDIAKCNDCGSELPEESPSGLCPACMIKLAYETGKDLEDNENVSSSKTTGWPEEPNLNIEELMPLFPELEIVEELGRGGMGIVVMARQKKLDRPVALKLLKSNIADDPTFAERFSREARALAKLNHPAIIGIYDFGQRDDLYYFLMEYVDGSNLRQIVREGNLKPEEALVIVPQICDALQYAHDMGVVHRDIKPENILIDKAGRVKIADFGLAKLVGAEADDFTLTGTRQVMGTPHYMAPEQMEKPHTVDHRADIYSLGVVFYEMLTGELPLGRFAPPSEKVEVNVRLDDVVLRALAKEPERRYQHATEVKTKIEQIGDPKPRLAESVFNRAANLLKNTREIEWSKKVESARSNISEGTRIAADGASVAGAYGLAAGEFAYSRSRRAASWVWDFLCGVWSSIRSVLGWMIGWTLLSLLFLTWLSYTWLPGNALMEYSVNDRTAFSLVSPDPSEGAFRRLSVQSGGHGTFVGVSRQARFFERTYATFEVNADQNPTLRMSVQFDDNVASYRIAGRGARDDWIIMQDAKPFEEWFRLAGVELDTQTKLQAQNLFRIVCHLRDTNGITDADGVLGKNLFGFPQTVRMPSELVRISSLIDPEAFAIKESRELTAHSEWNDVTLMVAGLLSASVLGIGYLSIWYRAYRRWRYG